MALLFYLKPETRVSELNIRLISTGTVWKINLIYWIVTSKFLSLENTLILNLSAKYVEKKKQYFPNVS